MPTSPALSELGLLHFDGDLETRGIAGEPFLHV